MFFVSLVVLRYESAFYNALRHTQRTHRLAHRGAVPRPGRTPALRPSAAVRGAGCAARHRGRRGTLDREHGPFRRRRRARAGHPQWLARADYLSRGRATLDREAWRSGDEFPTRDRALGRQVLYDGTAAGSRAADARDGRVRRYG